MFIFKRPFAAVAAALGVAFLMLWLEHACDGAPSRPERTRGSADEVAPGARLSADTY
jgi:hypothetical protein